MYVLCHCLQHSEKHFNQFVDSILFTKLCKEHKDDPVHKTQQRVNKDKAIIIKGDIQEALVHLKNGKPPGNDGIRNELLRYDGKSLY